MSKEKRSFKTASLVSAAVSAVSLALSVTAFFVSVPKLTALVLALLAIAAFAFAAAFAIKYRKTVFVKNVIKKTKIFAVVPTALLLVFSALCLVLYEGESLEGAAVKRENGYYLVDNGTEREITEEEYHSRNAHKVRLTASEAASLSAIAALTFSLIDKKQDTGVIINADQN